MGGEKGGWWGGGEVEGYAGGWGVSRCTALDEVLGFEFKNYFDKVRRS